jgi:hypothetical protein
MDTTYQITPLNKAAVLFQLRKTFSSLIGVPVNRILIEVRPKSVVEPRIASSRRLLDESEPLVVFVWVYPQIAVNGIAAWPTNSDPSVLMTKYEDTWSPGIVSILKDSYGTVELSEPCLDGAACPLRPLRPQLDDFSVGVAVDVGVVMADYTSGDVATITAVIKQEFALVLNIPSTDIRILSETRFMDKQISRFSVEVRVPSEASGLSIKAVLKKSAVTIAAHIKRDLGGNTISPIRSVTLLTSTITTIVDSSVKEPVVEPVSGGAITGFIILGVILVIAIGMVTYFYLRSRHKPDDQTLLGESVPVTHQFMPIQQTAIQQAYIPARNMASHRAFPVENQRLAYEHCGINSPYYRN